MSFSPSFRLSLLSFRLSRVAIAVAVLLLTTTLFFACADEDAGMFDAEADPAPAIAPSVPDTTPDTAGTAYQFLSASEAKAIMDSGESYILLDVRTEEEFRAEHVEGALLIPYDEVWIRATDELPDLDALILIYCRSGRRSAEAAYMLIDMGYSKVYDFGGILDWHYDTVGDMVGN